ncbi:MAG: hypothetical protein WKH97_01130 [Casimicrobiaceae bacterium]
MSLASTVRYLQEGNWEKAHTKVQDDESPLGCWAHGIVHMLEGDLENARYWYGKADRAFPEGVNAQKEISALALAVSEATK